MSSNFFNHICLPAFKTLGFILLVITPIALAIPNVRVWAKETISNTEVVKESREKMETERQVAEQVLDQFEAYTRQIEGLGKEQPGNPNNTTIGLVAPTQAPKLPDLTAEQKKLLPPEAIKAYEQVAKRTLNVQPPMAINIDPELLKPVELQCSVTDYVRPDDTKSVSASDLANGEKNLPLRMQGKQDVLSEELQARGGTPAQTVETRQRQAIQRAQTNTERLNSALNSSSSGLTSPASTEKATPASPLLPPAPAAHKP